MMRCQIKIDYVREVFFLMYIFLVLHQLPVFICITGIECYDLWNRTLFWYTLYQLYHASISVSRIFFSCILSQVFFINLCQYVKSRKEQNKRKTRNLFYIPSLFSLHLQRGMETSCCMSDIEYLFLISYQYIHAWVFSLVWYNI